MGILRRLLGIELQRKVEITSFGQAERPPYVELGDARGEPPPDWLGMRSGGPVDVVGEHAYRQTIAAVTGGPRAEGIRGTCWAVLVAEPNNRYDPNAISVRISSQTVGYLARADAKAMRPVLDRIAAAGRTAYCRADIRAGWNRSPTDTGDYGITLYFADVPEQHEMLDRVLDGKSRADIAAAKPPMRPGRARGPGMLRGRHHSEWHQEVGRLRAAGADAEAENLLIDIVDSSEQESAAEGFGVAPAAYETLAVMYRARKDSAGEIAILERFARQRHAPGVIPPKLLARLEKVKSERA